MTSWQTVTRSQLQCRTDLCWMMPLTTHDTAINHWAISLRNRVSLRVSSVVSISSLSHECIHVRILWGRLQGEVDPMDRLSASKNTIENKYEYTFDQELYIQLLAGSRQPADADAYAAESGCSRRRADAARALTRWQHISAWNDVMTAILKVWRQIENPTLSIDTHLLEEHSCQISSLSDLKWRSLRLFGSGWRVEERSPKDE